MFFFFFLKDIKRNKPQESKRKKKGSKQKKTLKMLRTLYIIYIYVFKSIKKSIHNIKHKFNGFFLLFSFWCVLSTLKKEGGWCWWR